MTAEHGILVLGYGNPARGDDGLGPALAQRIDDQAPHGVDAMWDYQPAVEHAADIAARPVVIFADASAGASEPFSVRRLRPRATHEFTTHALPPEAVLSLAHDALGWRGTAYLLALRGYSFRAFDETLSAGARENLRTAVVRVMDAIVRGRLADLPTDPPTDRSDRGGESWTDASV